MSQVIDWPGIRAAAVAIGVREAARRAAADLPAIEAERFVERVMKRSSREQWLAIKSAPPSKLNAQPLSAPVRNGSESLQNKLQADNDATKTALSKAARVGAEHLAKSKPVAILNRHHALRNVTSAASQLHGWEAKSGPQTNVMVNIALLGIDPGSVQVEAQTLDEQT